MKAQRIFSLFICGFLFSPGSYAGEQPNGQPKSPSGRPDGLKCEYLVNPLGIDAVHPRLSWMLEDTSQGAAQAAYQVYVDTDSAAVAEGKGNYWNTGRTTSSSSLITYQGKPLQPFTRYFWKVRVWERNGQEAEPSAIASFETGMKDSKNWKGSWISDDKSIRVNPAPYFRYTFHAARKIRSARAYIAVAGLYELYIDGQKIGDHRLDPMYTRFDRRTLYVTYDVTAQLTAGDNAIGVLLGNGWYNLHSTAVWNFDKAPWRGRPTFCLDLRITYDDGSVETISSSKKWKTALSPVIFNSIYTGEHYDARLEQPGWDMPGFDDSKWASVIYRSAPSANIVSQALQPIRNVEKIPAQ
jgi:alpha-L-rhamnosidase